MKQFYITILLFLAFFCFGYVAALFVNDIMEKETENKLIKQTDSLWKVVSKQRIKEYMSKEYLNEDSITVVKQWLWLKYKDDSINGKIK